MVEQDLRRRAMRVLIVDDDPLFRLGVATALAGDDTVPTGKPSAREISSSPSSPHAKSRSTSRSSGDSARSARASEGSTLEGSTISAARCQQRPHPHRSQQPAEAPAAPQAAGSEAGSTRSRTTTATRPAARDSKLLLRARATAKTSRVSSSAVSRFRRRRKYRLSAAKWRSKIAKNASPSSSDSAITLASVGARTIFYCRRSPQGSREARPGSESPGSLAGRHGWNGVFDPAVAAGQRAVAEDGVRQSAEAPGLPRRLDGQGRRSAACPDAAWQPVVPAEVHCLPAVTGYPCLASIDAASRRVDEHALPAPVIREWVGAPVGGLGTVEAPGLALGCCDCEVPVRPTRGRAAEVTPCVVVVGAPVVERDPVAIVLEPAARGSHGDRDAPAHRTRHVCRWAALDDRLPAEAPRTHGDSGPLHGDRKVSAHGRRQVDDVAAAGV